MTKEHRCDNDDYNFIEFDGIHWQHLYTGLDGSLTVLDGDLEECPFCHEILENKRKDQMNALEEYQRYYFDYYCYVCNYYCSLVSLKYCYIKDIINQFFKGLIR